MIQAEILATLNLYKTTWATGTLTYPQLDANAEDSALREYASFVESSPSCFERHHAPGHVTGSALISNLTMDQVLLIHHKKLGKWLQLGGHADGCPSPFQVAYREAQEESGLSTLTAPSISNLLNIENPGPEDLPFPLDLDIHKIPARGREAEHLHYDLRYLLVADPLEPLAMNEEANDLRWFSLDEAYKLTQEDSMIRQFNKLTYLKGHLTADT